MAKVFKNVKVDELTFTELEFLAKATNQKKSRILSELIGAIFDIACQYSTLNILYDGSFNESWLKLTFSGKSRLKSGIVLPKLEEEALKLEEVENIE